MNSQRSDTTSSDRPIVELTKVTKTYRPDVTALKDISLSVKKGEILFLSGMSGAGKSTLLKLIFGMVKPTKGVVEVDNNDLSRINSRSLQKMRQKIGVAYQDFRLLGKLTVFQNIAMSMEVAYKNPTIIRTRVEDLLDMLMLTDKRDTLVGKLSRGEQQRVAIARAAANSPPLLLADEPTGNLDATITSVVMNLFRQLNDSGTTIIIATHDTSIYHDTPHRLIEIKQGRLITKNTPQAA